MSKPKPEVDDAGRRLGSMQDEQRPEVPVEGEQDPRILVRDAEDRRVICPDRDVAYQRYTMSMLNEQCNTCSWPVLVCKETH